MNTSSLTPGGVPGLGDVVWGSHFCHFYETGNDLADTLVPFFKAGLDHDEACLWVTSDPFPASDARDALRNVVPDLAEREAKGQIEILDHGEWYRREGTQSAEQTLQGWLDRERRALDEGYRGLRLTGNTYWLERQDWDSFVEYEALVNDQFREHRIVGLCSYCLERCTSKDVLDVVRNHQFTVTRQADSWNVLESSALRAAREDVVRLQNAMEREREITEHLREAEARCRGGSQRKDQFLAMLGHELRNPLAPISTALELLGMRGARERFGRECEVIERQVGHLSSLVDDLLDISRITRGKLSLDPKPMELAGAVRTGIEIASPLLEERGQVLNVDVPETGLAVHGQAERLAQVVGNLLTNAAKHTPAGGTISVSALQSGARVELRVQDSGCGIDRELLPQIFDLFVQGNQSLDRSEGGLGLGLPIVRSLVELHGGSVSVTSEPGKGSEFLVVLPSLARDVSERLLDASPVADAEGKKGRKLLIVDDNEDAAFMLGALLEGLGFEVKMAHDGPAALELTAAFDPEVALVDIGLPVMDGYELGERLRDEIDDLQLIAVTGYGQPSDRERSRRAGFDAHLAKPVSLEQLQELLEA